jgi:hypothetical protein
MNQADRRLFVVSVPGLDLRQLGSGVTPFLDWLFAEYPSVRLRGQLTTEYWPSLVTGANPEAHQIWHVSLGGGESTWRNDLVDRLPDFLTTTAQCVWHLFDPRWDLPAIPPRRRRRFNIHRLKFTLRHEFPMERLGRIGDVPSLFGLLGGRSNYCASLDFEELRSQSRDLPHGQYELQFFEVYAFDLVSHWSLDRPRLINDSLRILDDSLRRMHQRCEEQGVTMLLVLPHGQEQVTKHINIVKLLRATGLPASEYDYFVAVAIARFWFSTERARRVITEALQKDPNIELRTNEQLSEYGINLEGGRWGQLYAIANPGSIYFPHDFYQPLGNLYLGLTQREQRPRLFNPHHRGYHGYLPHHAAERGLVLLADRGFTANRPESEFIDFAPTVLALLGCDKPESMPGQRVFDPLLTPRPETTASNAG